MDTLELYSEDIDPATGKPNGRLKLREIPKELIRAFFVASLAERAEWVRLNRAEALKAIEIFARDCFDRGEVYSMHTAQGIVRCKDFSEFLAIQSKGR